MPKMNKGYTVARRSGLISIDADWDKPVCQDAESIKVGTAHWQVQTQHLPNAQVKMQYDPENLK
ncbi:MAG: hypothetical protein ACYTFX_03320 [Planctomycetota bacterium]|jgi:hypothetical protein